MAAPNEPPSVRIYRMIHSQLPLDYMATDEGESTARRALDQAQHEYPDIAHLTWHDYVSYFVNKSEQERIKEKKSMPCYSLEDLWKFLHITQLQNSNDADRWANFLNKSFFPEAIDLGLLDGKTPLRLAPGNFYFAHYGNYCPPNHGYVATRQLAVEYQDRHAVEGAQYGPNSDDGVLRQFKEVGCILADKMGINGMNGWDRTGHVLVIDMGVGRNRHPWIILAREWELVEGYEFEEKEAPQSIGKNDSEALGIFPGHRDRTTIARLVARSGTDRSNIVPFLSRFGSNFNFSLDERGISGTMDASRGPELARTMPWVRRLDAPGWQQVCYSDDFGIKEYLRCDARNQRFIYPQSELGALEQQQTSQRGSSLPKPVPLSARSSNQPMTAVGSSSQSPPKRVSPPKRGPATTSSSHQDSSKIPWKQPGASR
ncbi:MAG: hypothetical protein Q9226_006394 [Calogaya cf. arnoldii]